MDEPTKRGLGAVGAGGGGPAPDPLDDFDGPVDIAAVHADDELLTALVSHDLSFGHAGRPEQAELKNLLLAWRLDVDAEPIGELVDTETAMATIAAAAVRNRRRRPRFLVPLASAAAVLVVVFAGMGLAARDAQPGDALWALSQVLYADHARSVEAAATVRSELSHASQALQQGHLGEARSALALAQNSLPAVATEDGQANLSAQQQTLLQRLNASTPVPTPSTMVEQSATETTPLIVPPATTAPVSTSPPPPVEPTQPSVEPTPSTTTPPPTSTTTPSVAPQSSPVSPDDSSARNGQQQGSEGAALSGGDGTSTGGSGTSGSGTSSSGTEGG